MKTKYAILISLLISFITRSQEISLPIINHHLADNPYLFSAAFAGIGDCFQVRASGLQQWLGVDNAPNTQTLSFDGRLADRSGIGAMLYRDSNGLTNLLGGKVSYAHHLTLNRFTHQYLSFGLSYVFGQFYIETWNFNQTTEDDITALRNFNHNIDVSMLYRLGRFYLSFTAENLMDKNIEGLSSIEPESVRSFSLYTGKSFYNEYTDKEYEPSIMYRLFENDLRSTLDINFKMRNYREKDYLWYGVSFKSILDQGFMPLSISPMVGFKTEKFYVSYGYQAFLNEFATVKQTGSHLLTVGFDFHCKKSNCGCTLLNPDEDDFYKF